jgi:hypothetical protein
MVLKVDRLPRQARDKQWKSWDKEETFSAGRNGFLMMDFGPNKEGLIAPDQVRK